MKAYADGRQLIAEIRRCFEKYDAEFEGIAEAERDLRFPETDRTPAENLSYQLGWLTLLLQWDKEERAGLQVTMPAAGYKWNDLGRLYQSFYAVYGIYTLAEQRKMLRRLVEDVCAWIELLSEEELFQPEMRRWATTNARWPLCRWIHINTVAPFTSFRTKFRKWKKVASCRQRN